MDSSDEDAPELETLDISNDQYYKVIPSVRTKNSLHEDFLTVPTYGSASIKHSLAAYDLWRPFFPTHLSHEKLLKFHRPKLRHYKIGPQAMRRGKIKAFPIKNLSREIYRSQKNLRNRIVRAINSGWSREEIVSKILLIRRAKDLTAKRGEMFLFEYSEEHPPVLGQIGMASNIKTYVQSSDYSSVNNNGSQRQSALIKSNRDNIDSPRATTTTANSQETTNSDHTQSSLKSGCAIGTREILSDLKQTRPIYFSKPKPGTETTFIENNLYRAPIYPHQIDDCDFLVIRTRNNIYVRSYQKIYTVGQTMPLDIIPPPTEKAITKFRADLSNLYLHKHFKESETDSQNPSIIDIGKILGLFPDYDRGTIVGRLYSSGTKRIADGLYHRNTSKYGLGTLLEDRSIIKPEQYCLYMSMLVSRQRLRELNYLESMIVPTDSAELEIEVLAAPWNISKAISDNRQGRCYLDFKQHLIDPTGPQREGFSCVAWSKSPTEEEQKCHKNKTLTGAQSQPAAMPSTNPMAFRIKKEKLERLAIYQKEAQLIYNLQSNMLSSREALSSDEGSDGEADEEDEQAISLSQQAKDLDRLVVDGRTNEELNFEREEEERLGLIEMMNVDGSGDRPMKENSNLKVAQDHVSQYKNKVLKIERQYKNEDGTMEVKTELIREPRIIARYLQLKSETAPSPQGNSETNNSAIPTPESTASPLADNHGFNRSFRRSSLGPSELCRSDGTTLIISKSVLPKNRRPRHSSRESRNHSFYS